MTQLMRLMVLVLVPLCVFVGAGCAAMTEVEAPAPAAQSATVQTAPAPANKPAWLRPEKEAALVEVRKILREARAVAEGISLPSSLFMNQARIRIYKGAKQKLLRETEMTQFWAGDFTAAVTSREYWNLALAQIRYGRLEEAVQTATSTTLSPAETLVILKLLSDAGDLNGAMQVAEAQVRPGTGPFGGPSRRQYEAEVMAYLARRQAQANNPEARETMRRAEYAVRTNNNFPRFQFGGAAAVGCAKAAMGDLTGSAESFRQAIHAAASIAQEEYVGEQSRAVMLVGRAAAESGLKTVRLEAFQEALRLARHIVQPWDRAKAMANVAMAQLHSGDRLSGQRTLEEAMQFAESVTDLHEQRRARGVIVEQQLEAGEREHVKADIDRMLKLAEGIADVKERARNRRYWELRAGDLMTVHEALDRADTLQGNDEHQAAALALAADKLVHSPKLVGTPEVLQRLSQLAEALLVKPVPTDRQKADQYLGNLATVQAVISGAPQALATARRLTDEGQKGVYLKLLALLIEKKDVGGAKQVVSLLNLNDDGLVLSGESGKTLGDKVLAMVKVQAESGDISGALQWAQQQTVGSHAKVQSLLGVALGLMERNAIYDLHQHLLSSMTFNKGVRDTLTLRCSNL
ncbi:MAG: hypothetical protein OEY77_13940 [Nitrospira sp.]|nr:hypothetical protein [Nitrospira sp.]